MRLEGSHGLVALVFGDPEGHMLAEYFLLIFVFLKRLIDVASRPGGETVVSRHLGAGVLRALAVSSRAAARNQLQLLEGLQISSRLLMMVHGPQVLGGILRQNWYFLNR